EGSIDGTREVVIATDSSGAASASVTLGEELGENKLIVHAVSHFNGSPLQGSPIIFYASVQLGQPQAIHVLSDTTNLIGAANHALPQPIIVKIADQDGQAIAGFTVQCHISSGSGSFQENGERSIDLTTDSDGRAFIRWVLGGLGERQRLVVIALVDGRHLANSPLTIAASTVSSTANELVILSGNGQSAARGEILQHPFIVRILDTYNEPVAGHSVFFCVAKGDGVFTASGTPNYTARTDADGSAVAFFRLGQVVGHKAYEIVVRSFSESGIELFNSPDTIYVHGTARELAIISGNGQSQTVNQMLTPLRVRLADENNLGIADANVAFELLQGDVAFLDSLNQTTDGAGYAQIEAKVGRRSGKIIIKAVAPAFSSTVSFFIRALPDQPFALRKMSGDEQTGIAHHPLNQKIVVRLTDQYENGIAGNRVLFETLPGHGFIAPTASIETDSIGLVNAAWQLGSVTPQQCLAAKTADLSLDFTAHVLPNQAPAISAPDSLFTAENDKVRIQLSFTDAENDSISFAMLNGPQGAVLHPATAIFSWTPSYEQAGLHDIVFQARDEFGAFTAKSLHVRVANANRPPKIADDQCRPSLRRLGKIKIPATVDFHVHATDVDGDALHYLWQVNGHTKGASNNYRLYTQSTGSGEMTVQALVYDQEDTVSTSWTLEVITSVELKSFIAMHVPYAGIRLTWESRYEWDNTGFNVLRSTQKEGPFETVSAFIAARSDGKYHFTDENIESGITYFYQVQDVQSNGARHASDVIQIAPPLPDQFALHQNYPNPFNPSTILRFDIAEPSFVTLVVYDLLGRQARMLIAAELRPGFHKIAWDGVNDYGEPVASGLYHAVLETPGGRFVQKMMLVR
ncbi:hypothetical protein JXA02_05170, partial [candidate division KSB1 bacterium]|nr:hypothetical protein [candidate division KSB1 bacterium]